jgi:hypothetical protein
VGNLLTYYLAQLPEGFNIDKALNYLKSNLLPPYGQGKCSSHMHQALIEGGLDSLKDMPVQAARKYGPILKEMGFVEVFITDCFYTRGDIAVFQGYPGGRSDANGIPYGHIQMFDGEYWISDFLQPRPLYPSQKYQDNSCSYVILRWGGN